MIDIRKHSLYKQLDFDSALSNIFQLYLNKFWPLFIISFMALFLLQMVFYQLGFYELYQIEDPEELMDAIGTFMSKISIVSISFVLVYGVLNALLINFILRKDIEPELPFGEIFTESIRKHAIHMIFFMILSMIILMVAMAVGVIAIIIGMLFAALYIGVVLMPGGAILVAEDKNAIDTIGRTFSMVHKDFWNNMGIFIVFLLIMILLSIVIGALAAVPFLVMFFDGISEGKNFFEALNIHSYDMGIWVVVMNSAVAALTYPLYATLSTVLYLRLKYQEDQKNIIK